MMYNYAKLFTMEENMKKFGKFIALVFASLGMLLAFVGCGGNGCKEAAEALVSAKSFTVKKSDSEILRYAGNTAYWKYTDSLGEYTEYYFYPDSEGKHWIYEKAFKADEWTKEAVSADRYVQYLYMVKNSLGWKEGTMDYVACITMDFDGLMTSVDGKYRLKDSFSIVKELTVWQEKGALMIDATVYTTKVLLAVSAINGTKVELPANVAQNAKVGSIDMP